MANDFEERFHSPCSLTFSGWEWERAFALRLKTNPQPVMALESH
jgi:hypothetical protein